MKDLATYFLNDAPIQARVLCENAISEHVIDVRGRIYNTGSDDYSLIMATEFRCQDFTPRNEWHMYDEPHPWIIKNDNIILIRQTGPTTDATTHDRATFQAPKPAAIN